MNLNTGTGTGKLIQINTAKNVNVAASATLIQFTFSTMHSNNDWCKAITTRNVVKTTVMSTLSSYYGSYNTAFTSEYAAVSGTTQTFTVVDNTLP